MDFTYNQNSSAETITGLQKAFGLNKYDIQDVSIHGAPVREAYFETIDALTFSQSDEAKKEGYSQIRPSAIDDVGKLLSGILKLIPNVPAITPLGGGGIGLQWNGDNERIFTASLLGDNQIVYCSIFSETRGLTATCEVSPLPSSFIFELGDILGVKI